MVITVFSALTRLIGFVYKIFLSRALGAEALGVYSVTLSVFTIFVTLTSSGIPIAVSRLTAKYYGIENSKDFQDRAVTAAIAVNTVITFALSSLLLLFGKYLKTVFVDERCHSLFCSLIPSFIASGFYSAFRGGIWGNKRFFAYSFVELFEEILMCLFGFVLLSFFKNTFSFELSLSTAVNVSFICSALLSGILYYFGGGRLKKNKSMIAPLVKSATPITLVRLASSLTSSLIAVSVPALLQLHGMTLENALSVYGALMGMSFSLLYLPNTFTGSLALVLVPEISSFKLKTKKFGFSCCFNQKLITAVENSLNVSLLISVCVATAYLAMGNEFASLLFNNSLSGHFLTVCSFITIPMSLNLITNTVLNSLGFENSIFVNNLIGDFILITFSVGLSAIIGINALICGFYLQTLTTFVLNFNKLKRKISLSLRQFRKCIPLLIGIIPNILLTKYLRATFFSGTPNILTIVIPMCFSGALTLLIGFLCGIIQTEHVFEKKPNKASNVCKFCRNNV